MDPIFLYVLAVIFIGGPLLAAVYIRFRRWSEKRLRDALERKTAKAKG